MDTCYRLLALLFLAVSVFHGCITVHAPLVPDKEYPHAWGNLSTLGPECKSVEGTYMNDGAIIAIDGNTRPLSLTSVLNISFEARIVSLYVHTRKIDQNGDAFITLRVVPDGNTAVFHDLDGCFCVKQTLACTQVYETYWSIPNLGLGGKQKNVYFSLSQDRSLIAKLQNYHVDIIFAIPIYGMKEPWARFKAADQ
jgi:hypothetical protein